MSWRSDFWPHPGLGWEDPGSDRALPPSWLVIPGKLLSSPGPAPKHGITCPFCKAPTWPYNTHALDRRHSVLGEPRFPPLDFREHPGVCWKFLWVSRLAASLSLPHVLTTPSRRNCAFVQLLMCVAQLPSRNQQNSTSSVLTEDALAFGEHLDARRSAPHSMGIISFNPRSIFWS